MLDLETTRFALWAPDAFYVSLDIEGGESVPMLPQADGWFAIEIRCPVDTLYRFNIDGEIQVPDPASRAQHSDVHSPSVVVNPLSYDWKHTAWQGRPWTQAVIYELHVGALGGYRGVIEHLPRLAALGVTAIELMPVAEFPGARNWGYDGVLPYAPEASYGSPDDLKLLIDSAHGLGLMVILDVVYNHFGPDGNYLSRYAKDFFRQDKHTPWGDAIDFRRPEVRSFFIDNALMWILEYRFDGLRFDAVHAIEDPTFLQEMATTIRAQVDSSRHVWLMLENEFNQAHLLEQGYDAQWNDDGHNALHVLLTDENEAYYADFSEQTTDKLVRCLSQGFIYQGEKTLKGHARGEPSGHLPPSAFVLFLQNHDQIGNRAMGERLHQLCNPNALRAATALLLLSPMIPMMFMGDEWAADEPFFFFTDHHGELAEAVREGRRNEFAAFSAFADEHKRELIPDPNAAQTFEASRPNLDDFHFRQDGPWIQLYRELLALRRDEIVPRLDGAHSLGAHALGERAVSARWQMGDGCELRIDVNLSGTDRSTSLPDAAHHLFNSRLDCAGAGTAPADASHTRTLTAFTTIVSLIPSDARETPHE